MKQITVLNVAIQFDSTGKGRPKQQAQNVIDLINKTLSEAGLNCEPQLFVVDGLQEEDVKVEEK